MPLSSRRQSDPSAPWQSRGGKSPPPPPGDPRRRTLGQASDWRTLSQSDCRPLRQPRTAVGQDTVTPPTGIATSGLQNFRPSQLPSSRGAEAASRAAQPPSGARVTLDADEHRASIEQRWPESDLSASSRRFTSSARRTVGASPASGGRRARRRTPLLAPRDVDMATAVTFWEQTSCRRETLCAPGRPDGRKLLTGHGFPAGDRGLQAAPGTG